MRILVSGASGRVGHLLVDNLAAAGHEVIAGTRHLDDKFNSDKVELANIDLLVDEEQLVTELTDLKLDAVYFVAGSRGKNVLQVDAFGAVKLENAAEKVGIKRFIMLSAWQATNPKAWGEELRDYYIARFFADNWLMDHTTLNYTILQPGNLLEEAGSGKVQFNPKTATANSIENVADVLAGILNAENTYGKLLPMGDGETDIATAIAKL
ncbi:MAG TPA: NAD(P)H-binding protein [Weissella thailandensis]|uniref:NAD(P)H-binding protein n=1 Tax=Weissella thailandensis TaxID=89061 RepID=UPI001D85790D|nr:NAD(P)H-binding protein [Weissella thailandensis]HJG84772.1 NAD(P)H-binding protein [Weissella thailandensis]